LRRNTDKALPASHTVEIRFDLPADFAAGGIANVTAIVMKQSEEARGSKLAARVAKVTNGFFLIGLSAADTDVQRDKQLLKDRPWFDIGSSTTTATKPSWLWKKAIRGIARSRKLFCLGQEIAIIPAQKKGTRWSSSNLSRFFRFFADGISYAR
jgi:hypothetical protein